MEPFALTACEIADKVSAGRLSPRKVIEFYLERIATQDRYNALFGLDPEIVAEQINVLESRLSSGESLPLAGVPIAVKDNIVTKGIKTTCASRLLSEFFPPYDATVVENLQAAGAVIVAKANMDEFGMGSSSENSAYGPVRNPWDLHRVPGGSSGGSAAAVASDLVPIALGSDTGGSIRQPASFCGIVGLKPSYGRVSRYGLVAFGSSLDQVGPMTRNVEDAALLLDVLSGKDFRDSTSLPLPPTETRKALSEDAGRLRIGVIEELSEDGIDPDVAVSFKSAIQSLTKLGHDVQTVSVPSLRYSVSCYYVLANAEASANLARFDGVRYGTRANVEESALKRMYEETRSRGFGREVKQRIMLGTFALSSGYYDAYYAKAKRARQLIADEFESAFSKYELLVSPTAPTTAFPIGAKRDDPLSMYLSDVCTVAASLARIPAISLPCGYTADGLPVGLQVMARENDELTLLRGALAFERQQENKRRPQ